MEDQTDNKQPSENLDNPNTNGHENIPPLSPSNIPTKDPVEQLTGIVTAMEITTDGQKDPNIIQLTPLSPTSIIKQHLSRSLSDVSLPSTRTSFPPNLKTKLSSQANGKPDKKEKAMQRKSKSDSNVDLKEEETSDKTKTESQKLSTEKGAHASLPILYALRSSEKTALRSSAPPSIAPESRRGSPSLDQISEHIAPENATAPTLTKSGSTGRKSFIHRLFHHEDRPDSSHSSHQQRSGHLSAAESDISGHGEDHEHPSNLIIEEEVGGHAAAAFPSKKHRFHLDHLFRDLLHNKLHSPGSIFGSAGSIADSTAPSRSSSRNSLAAHSDDDGEHMQEAHSEDNLGEDGHHSRAHEHDKEKKNAISSLKTRARAESSSTGRKRSGLTSAFRQLMMPAKHSTRAAKAAEAEGGCMPPDLLLEQKYGSYGKVLGKGAGGVVRMCQMMTTQGQKFNKVYAVKEFKRRKNETEREHVKKLTSEFCISSRLHHCNIIQTVDLVQDESKHWCEIMEYCPHGDLYEFIRSGTLEQVEIDCFFKQLIRGVEYLHSVGVAHRDLKPENLLIDEGGQLKITDFGVSDVFQIAWEKQPHYSKGVCGSEPYIAPEEFCGEPYDAREVDVWAMAVIYYALNFTGVPWRTATPNDPNYAYYLKYRGDRFEPFSRFPPASRSLIHRMFEPNPKKRISVADIILTPWFIQSETCSGMDHPEGTPPPHVHASLEKKIAMQSS